jgi:hypothetical protein
MVASLLCCFALVVMVALGVRVSRRIDDMSRA